MWKIFSGKKFILLIGMGVWICSPAIVAATAKAALHHDAVIQSSTSTMKIENGDIAALAAVAQRTAPSGIIGGPKPDASSTPTSTASLAKEPIANNLSSEPARTDVSSPLTNQDADADLDEDVDRITSGGAPTIILTPSVNTSKPASLATNKVKSSKARKKYNKIVQ